MSTKMREERVARKWTQQYVAERAGVTKAAIHDMETGRRKPSYDVLIKLLDLFGCTDPRDLFATGGDAPGDHYKPSVDKSKGERGDER